MVVFFHGYGAGGSSGSPGRDSSESSGEGSQAGGSSDCPRGGGTNGSCPLYQWADKRCEYHGVEEAVESIKGRVGPPTEQTRPIVIGGHSWGGNSAITTAKKLIAEGYPVDFLFTLDPVSGIGMSPGSHGPIEGVDVWWNFYPGKDYPTGMRIPDADVNEEAFDDDGRPLGHREIDDDRAISDRIKAHVDEVLRTFEMP